MGDPVFGSSQRSGIGCSDATIFGDLDVIPKIEYIRCSSPLVVDGL